MIFYRHHIGDHLAATNHLSWDEDSAYRRLRDVYLKTEKPIPKDLEQACRLVRADTPERQAAVRVVLQEFFTRERDGWHHTAWDRDIADVAEKGEEAEEKRENDRERQRRSRAERARLFKALREKDVVPPYNTSMEDLREMLAKLDVTRVVGALVTPVTRDGSHPVTRDNTGIASSHEPVASNHKPRPRGAESRGDSAREGRVPLPEDWRPSAADWTAASLERPDLDLELVTRSFTEHHRAQRNERVDWPSEWRKWVRKEHGRSAAAAGWRTSVDRAKQVGKAIGLEPRVGEQLPDFVARIDAKQSAAKASAT